MTRLDHPPSSLRPRGWATTTVVLLAAVTFSQLLHAQAKMYYDIPPYTQLDTVFELWQREQIEEGHQKAQRLLEQVQAGDSAVEPHAMWQLEQQTVLRARVTTLYMNLYYRKQLASVMKSGCGCGGAWSPSRCTLPSIRGSNPSLPPRARARSHPIAECAS